MEQILGLLKGVKPEVLGPHTNRGLKNKECNFPGFNLACFVSNSCTIHISQWGFIYCEPVVSEFDGLENLGIKLWNNCHPMVLKDRGLGNQQNSSRLFIFPSSRRNPQGMESSSCHSVMHYWEKWDVKPDVECAAMSRRLAEEVMSLFGKALWWDEIWIAHAVTIAIWTF